MRQTPSPFARLVCLLLLVSMSGCGGTPIQPDNSREEMEDRRDKAFRELK